MCHPSFLILNSLAVFLLSISIALSENLAVADSSQSAVKYSSIRGEDIYRKLCAQCHGDGSASNQIAREILSPAPPELLKSEKADLDYKSYLIKRISVGTSKNMIHFSGRLSENQIESLAAFILGYRQDKKLKSGHEQPEKLD